MRKGNPSLKSGLRAVTLMIVSSLLLSLVSCYDDHDLKNRVNDLDDRVTELESAVSKIQNELSALQTLTNALNNKVLVSSIIENDEGNYVITYTNGDKSTLTIPDASDAISSIPIVTMIEEDGEYFWALDTNGEVEPLLDANGNKMPVSGKTPQIRINPDTYEWEISIDNGKTWESTGVVAAGDSSDSLFESITQDDDYVYFNLVGGTQVKIGKATDMIFNIVAGPQYFAFGEEKVLKVNMEGVFRTAVSKPDGWRAAITADGLKITAPAEDNTYAETEGVVAITAVSSDGKSVIEEVSVRIGEAPIKLTLNESLLNVQLSSASIRYYYLGIFKATEFSVTNVDAVLNSDKLWELGHSGDLDIEVSEIDPTVEVEPGVDYIIWAVATNYGNIDLNELSTIAYYKEPERIVEATVVSVGSTNAEFAMSMTNCNQYYMGVAPSGGEVYKEDVIGTITGWAKHEFVHSATTIYLTDLKDNWVGDVVGIPNSTYNIWYTPVKDGYVEDDIKVLQVTLGAADYTGTASVTVKDLSVSITSYSATLSPSSDTKVYYYMHMMSMDYAALSSDAEIINYIMRNGQKSSYEIQLTQEYLTPETDYYLCALSEDYDGKFGPVTKQMITTRGLSFDGTASATAAITPAYTSATVQFTPSGNVGSYRYMILNSNDFLYGFNENAAEVKNTLALNTDWRINNVNPASLSNNQLELNYLTIDSKYYFFALVVDEQGGLSSTMIDINFNTKLFDIIRTTSADYKAPSVEVTSISKDPDFNFYGVTYNITPCEGTEKTYFKVVSGEELSTLVTFKDKVRSVVKEGSLMDNEYLDNLYFYSSLPYYIMVVGVKDADTVYETYVYEVLPPTE